MKENKYYFVFKISSLHYTGCFYKMLHHIVHTSIILVQLYDTLDRQKFVKLSHNEQN